MRFVRGTVLALLLVGFGGVLAGCDTLENFQIWDTKKKLTGERKEVFPGGVPGVTQGIPPDLVKGYQEPQQAAVDPAAVAAQESAEKAEAKPKPKKVAKPRPVQPPPQQAQQPASAGQGGWPGQQPQQAQQPQPTQGWPGSQPQAQQQSGWPQAH